MKFVNKIIYSIQKKYQRFNNKRGVEKKEQFIASLDERQLKAFNTVAEILNGYQNCICYKYSSTIVIEKEIITGSGIANGISFNQSIVLISIDLYASQCMVSVTCQSPGFIKDFEARYFDDNATHIFEQMVHECLKRKHRSFIEKRNEIIV